MKTLKISMILLVLAASLLYGQRWAFVGASFLFTLAALACLAAAFFLALFLPWKKPGSRRVCKVLRRAYLVAALAFIISFAAVQNAINDYAAEVHAEQPNAQCLLVLGAGLYGETPSLTLANRLQAALTYMLDNPDSVAVLSGGQGRGETITEALAMRRWLVVGGIEESRLYMEDRATSTKENIVFSKPVIETLGYDTALVVTNDFHLLRSSMLAARYGLNAEFLGAPLPTINLTPFICHTREYFALIKDWLFK